MVRATNYPLSVPDGELLYFSVELSEIISYVYQDCLKKFTEQPLINQQIHTIWFHFSFVLSSCTTLYMACNPFSSVFQIRMAIPQQAVVPVNLWPHLLFFVSIIFFKHSGTIEDLWSKLPLKKLYSDQVYRCWKIRHRPTRYPFSVFDRDDTPFVLNYLKSYHAFIRTVW